MHHLVFFVTETSDEENAIDQVNVFLEKMEVKYNYDYWQIVAVHKRGTLEYSKYKGYERFPYEYTDEKVRQMYKEHFEEDFVISNNKTLQITKRAADKIFKALALKNNLYEFTNWVKKNTSEFDIYAVQKIFEKIWQLRNSTIIENNYNFWISEYADIGTPMALINLADIRHESEIHSDLFLVAVDIHT